MKKFNSILLTAVLLFALMIPSFAANITVSGNTGDVVVKTSTTTADGSSAEKFDVTIPADTTIVWGTETTTLTYSYETHLGYNKTLDISVKASSLDNANAAMAFSDTTAVGVSGLPYTLTGTTQTTATTVVYPEASAEIYVNITDENWNKAVVGEYSDTLTFTAEVVAA